MSAWFSREKDHEIPLITEKKQICNEHSSIYKGVGRAPFKGVTCCGAASKRRASAGTLELRYRTAPTIFSEGTCGSQSESSYRNAVSKIHNTIATAFIQEHRILDKQSHCNGVPAGTLVCECCFTVPAGTLMPSLTLSNIYLNKCSPRVYLHHHGGVQSV